MAKAVKTKTLRRIVLRIGLTDRSSDRSSSSKDCRPSFPLLFSSSRSSRNQIRRTRTSASELEPSAGDAPLLERKERSWSSRAEARQTPSTSPETRRTYLPLKPMTRRRKSKRKRSVVRPYRKVTVVRSESEMLGLSSNVHAQETRTAAAFTRRYLLDESCSCSCN
eukprot:766605-Hanusia_phi.AAC.11